MTLTVGKKGQERAKAVALVLVTIYEASVTCVLASEEEPWMNA